MRLELTTLSLGNRTSRWARAGHGGPNWATLMALTADRACQRVPPWARVCRLHGLHSGLREPPTDVASAAIPPPNWPGPQRPAAPSPCSLSNEARLAASWDSWPRAAPPGVSLYPPLGDPRSWHQPQRPRGSHRAKGRRVRDSSRAARTAAPPRERVEATDSPAHPGEASSMTRRTRMRRSSPKRSHFRWGSWSPNSSPSPRSMSVSLTSHHARECSSTRSCGS